MINISENIVDFHVDAVHNRETELLVFCKSETFATLYLHNFIKMSSQTSQQITILDHNNHKIDIQL
jgi:hypothetical protein